MTTSSVSRLGGSNLPFRRLPYATLLRPPSAIDLTGYLSARSGALKHSTCCRPSTPGHSGTLATIHANGATQAIARLASCVLQAGVDLPFTAIRSSIADSLNLLLHVDRRNGTRCVS